MSQTLPNKLLVFLALLLCAPLYLMLRFFYGAAFFKMVALATVLNVFGIAILQGFVVDDADMSAALSIYDPGYAIALGILAIYLVAALSTASAPKFSLTRWRLNRASKSKLRFDDARVAVKPFR